MNREFSPVGLFNVSRDVKEKLAVSGGYHGEKVSKTGTLNVRVDGWGLQIRGES